MQLLDPCAFPRRDTLSHLISDFHVSPIPSETIQPRERFAGPLAAGIIAGIVGGLIVGALSGSSTSVTGPAAGLTAVVAAQIAELGSFQAFLVAVVVAGALQIVFGILKGGFLSSFFPSSVVKGLLAAIGIIIILKQLPHLVGYDADPVGDTNFTQPDQK
ncbi:MAG: SulP family inorganic anion transporter, partial [Verrucomicrobia bacterium]|nr:SulP family inorganic anion transporter [Verrucomicrobiota bacterium]